MDELNPFFSKSMVLLAAIAAISTIIIGTFLPTLILSGGIVQASGKSPEIVLASLGVQEAMTLRLEGFTKAIAQKQTDKEKRFTFAVTPEFRGKTLYDVALDDSNKAIALTFDDGPWPIYTEQVLDILEQNDIKATFFLIGQHLKHHSAIAEKVVEAGHALGNHTWNHHYHNVPREVAAKEIEDTAALIYEVTGFKTEWFRPPGGVLTNGLNAYALSQNYAVAMWSSDARESSFSSSGALVNNVLNGAKPGGIVLLHDGGGNRSATVQALPIIITKLKERGYRFVTLPELLELYEQHQQSTIAENTPNPTPVADGIE
ncbi:polysaccharide deacetylase family protein [Oscillatoria acuminata]|uniref:Putative xylanase/chitin deacetylase n=1 Tax=Oscillatoria acuminata PCC 6304 TaxID=56110 RepID=K9TMC9_9CYAN|nr:polysaccharide deacetylase family protein [Oscillatoria acuminata]AFY83700.1 putative xylanase/chitin deacetylase [Oscillatoria acuminata PCC 6304]